MTIGVDYSTQYWAKRKRLQRMAKLSNDMVSGGIKRDLTELNKIFHDGIKKNSLGLDKLVDSTVLSKISKGYEKPYSPLYGAGDSEGDRSYSNMMKITKVAKGYKLEPNPRLLHHSRKIKVKDLFTIHEHGAIVIKGDVMIKIPPRPALMISYRKWLVKRKQREPTLAKEVKVKISEYIKEGKTTELLNWAAWYGRT